MFSKSQIKFIKSLSKKKYRQKHRVFVVEGQKGIEELLNSSLRLHSLYTTEKGFSAETEKIQMISEGELAQISNLSTPQTALAVFHMPPSKEPELNGMILALDGVQDPGNLGTIIRMCDWFGIKNLVCSKGCVDCYNPKVVQATMGSISRVPIVYTDLPGFLKKAQKQLPVYGAFLEGKNVYSEPLWPEGVLVLGNEANGISQEVAAVISRRLSIPRSSAASITESLNVATATAILLSEFCRETLTGR